MQPSISDLFTAFSTGIPGVDGVDQEAIPVGDADAEIH